MPVHSKPFESTRLPRVVPAPWQLLINLLSWTSVKPHQFAAAMVIASKMHLLKTFRQFHSLTLCTGNQMLLYVELRGFCCWICDSDHHVEAKSSIRTHGLKQNWLSW